MKKKIFSTLFALVLLAGLSLVPAVVMGQGSSNYAEYELVAPGSGIAEWSTDYARSGKYSLKLSALADAPNDYGKVTMPLDMEFEELVDFSAYVEGGLTAQALPLLDIQLEIDDVDVILTASNKDTGAGVNLRGLTVILASQPGQCELRSDTLMSDGLAGWEKYGTHSDSTINVGGDTNAYWSMFVYSNYPGVWEGTYDYYTWDEIHGFFDGKATVSEVRVELRYPQDPEDVASIVYVDDVKINGVTYDLQPPLSMDDSFYQTDETVTVTVIDASANTSATTRETVLVDADSTIPVYSIVLGLLETGVNTGVFTETFTLVGTTPGTGELLVSHGSLITVTYGSDTDTAGVDNVAPVIVITSPTASSNITDATPEIKATYTDGTGPSGINITSVVMTVDGSAVTANVTTTSSVTYWPTANLTEGSHPVTVDVSDLAGNAATQKSWSFTVDTVDPVITSQVATPSVVTPAVSANITFTATVADATSGVATVTIDVSSIDTATALPMLNDGDGIYSANITTTIATEDTYKLLVTATDEAGNSDSANITLVVALDTKAPAITSPAITYPFIGVESAMPGASVIISANVTDNVEVASVVATSTALTDTVTLLDGGDLPDMTAGDDIYTGTGTVASVVAGDYTITITATDGKSNVDTDTSLSLTVDPAATGHDIDLFEGWNLISLPLIPTDGSIDVVLAEISDNVSQVRTWVYVAGVLTEKIWAEGGAVGLLDEMVDGQGYWIEMTEANELTVTGSVLPAPPQTPPSYSVYEGWNLVGFKSLDVSTTAQAYLGPAVTATFEAMYGYNAAGGVYTVIQLATPNLEPGQGYWLAVSADGTIYP